MDIYGKSVSVVGVACLLALFFTFLLFTGCSMDEIGDSEDDDGSYDDDDHGGGNGDDDPYDDDDASDDDFSGDDDWTDDEPVGDDEPDFSCPEDTEPTELYMSADDSNSQASPVVARGIIQMGQIVPAGKVRTYEFTNYYQIEYPTDFSGRVDIVPQLRVRENSEQELEYVFQIGVQGNEDTSLTRRPINITLSLDTSGSMSGQPIALLRDVCRAIVGQLRPGDVISMVEWDSTTNVVLDSHLVSQANDPALLNIIDNLQSNGSTDLHGGLVRAYELAGKNYNPDRINRVVLISDGGANTGVTDIEIISQAADDSEAEGIYMVGVGVGDPYGYYNDDLMDNITDAGKGAYLFIDSTTEANKQFGERFIENIEITAMGVRVKLSMPYYLIMSEFHGEEYSENPEEVEPQHLAPNDAMIYHQYLVACDPLIVNPDDIIQVEAEYTDPETRQVFTDISARTMATMLAGGADQLIKGDAVVTYAEALKKISTSLNEKTGNAVDICLDARDRVSTAATLLQDSELQEIVSLLDTYLTTLGSK